MVHINQSLLLVEWLWSPRSLITIQYTSIIIDHAYVHHNNTIVVPQVHIFDTHMPQFIDP